MMYLRPAICGNRSQVKKHSQQKTQIGQIKAEAKAGFPVGAGNDKSFGITGIWTVICLAGEAHAIR